MQSINPDFSTMEIPWDSWSEPFWRAGEKGETRMPACTSCGTFRWPAGPFCPQCRQQEVEWREAGQGRIFSFTVLPERSADPDQPPAIRMPALVEFDEAPGVRLVSVLVEADPVAVAIGAAVNVEWVPAANTVAPVFRLAESGT